MKNTVESRVADAILQNPKAIVINNQTYEVAPPSTATLIMISELVSKMPHMDANTTDIIGEALRVAKDSKVIGDIAATAILGAKRIRDEKIKSKRSFFDKLLKRESEFNKLSRMLLEELSPARLSEILGGIIANRMDIDFFFNISISLSGVNLTKAKKKETTVSGRL